MEWTLLGGLGEAERRAVLAAATRRKFRRDEVLFHEGDVGDTYHLIAKGKVAVQVSTPNGDLATLSVISAGDGIGELALVGHDTARSATVRALEPTETLMLHRTAFDDLCKRQPGVQRLLIDLLAQQVRRLSQQVLEATFVPAELRVIRRLHELATIYDTGSTPITIPVTQEALATMAGTTRPTVNRALRDLETAGVVELGRGRTEVTDLAVLARRAR
jgi:CRP-like cAMP-binding protein